MDWLKRLLRSFLSQQYINFFYHLPKAILANVFYGFPTSKLRVVGVSGTDGKTTTVNMIYQILKFAGKKASMISTINAEIGGKSYDTGFHVTSPDPFMIQKFAREALDGGCEYLVLEVTSHGLDQYRFWGIKFEIGIITNITHEHLDYHKTFENYARTKLNLIASAKYSVVNDNLKQYVVRSCKLLTDQLFTFGLSKGDFNQKEIKLKLKIPGEYNIENGLAALAVAFVSGIDRKIAQKVLEKVEGIKGRMEEVKNNRGIKIVIDFAHTPNGLDQALKALRSQSSKGKLISVIGCEGFRDIGKRAMMGQIAQKLADIVVVTALDPRGQLETVNQQIKEGAMRAGAKTGENFFIIEDRQKAIDFAIDTLAKKGDIVGIFGKGHEKSMNLDGKKEINWSDEEAVLKEVKPLTSQ